MRPYWISWWQTRDLGEFELHSPWWISGFRLDDGADSVVAAVMADDEEAAREVIRACFDSRPAVVEFRFASPHEPGWSPFCDRFPRADWMRWPVPT